MDIYIIIDMEFYMGLWFPGFKNIAQLKVSPTAWYS